MFDINRMMSDPMLQLGMGLLQAGQPSRMPQGIGQGLLNAYGINQQAQQMGMNRQLQQMKLDTLQQNLLSQQRRQKAIGGLMEQLPEGTSPMMGSLLEAFPEKAGEMMLGQMMPQKPISVAPGAALYDPGTQKWITPSQTTTGGWTREAMRKEYDYMDFTPQSIKQAERLGDPEKLIPHTGYRNLDDIVRDRNAFAPSRKVFDKVATSARQLDKLLGLGGGIADVGAMVNFVKSLDPESVVREGEVRVTQAATGYFNELKVAIDKLGPKGAGMTPEIRQQMKDAANSLIDEYKKSYASETEPYMRRAQQGQVNSQEVLGGDIIWPTFETPVYGGEQMPWEVNR